MRRALAILVAGVAAGAAWFLGIAIVFGPAQGILADPARQSAKFIAAFADPQSPPRMGAAPWILPAGLVVVGLAASLAYAIVRRGLPGGPARRGAIFGVVAWLLMTPWFEFYLPYNVMLEPLPLVLLEALLWGIVLQLVGQAIAWSGRAVDGRRG